LTSSFHRRSSQTWLASIVAETASDARNEASGHARARAAVELVAVGDLEALPWIIIGFQSLMRFFGFISVRLPASARLVARLRSRVDIAAEQKQQNETRAAGLRVATRDLLSFVWREAVRAVHISDCRALDPVVFSSFSLMRLARAICA
jgi:hypothetical protein